MSREPGIKAGMSAPWIPLLTVREHSHGCRLYLAGDAWGDGATLQEAADDLVARVTRLARASRTGGFTCAHELGAPDRRWLEFIYQLGEIAERGGDVRRRVLEGA
jgi:hypothetical protein